MNNLYTYYQKEGSAELAKSLNIKNKMAILKLVKIVVNIGIGEAVSDKKVVENVSAQLIMITGQKPYLARSRKAISSFKLRIGDPVGLKVTLRGKRMYDFLTKLTQIALPRVRDFRGIPLSGFDGQGNYTMGIKEQTIFPELEYKLVDKMRGFEISFVTTATDTKQSYELLKLLGLPFEKKEA